jgi:hypothetical protein
VTGEGAAGEGTDALTCRMVDDIIAIRICPLWEILYDRAPLEGNLGSAESILPFGIGNVGNSIDICCSQIGGAADCIRDAGFIMAIFVNVGDIAVLRVVLFSNVVELISKMSFRRVFEEESPLRTPAEGDSSLRSE